MADPTTEPQDGMLETVEDGLRHVAADLRSARAAKEPPAVRPAVWQPRWRGAPGIGARTFCSEGLTPVEI